MGQYYKAVLVDTEWKVKVVEPSWCKLMEHSWYGNTSMQRIEKLLFKNAMNVMRVWDYSQMASICWKHKFEDEEDWYKMEYSESDLLQREEWQHYYLVNKFSKEFIDMTEQKNNIDLKDWYWCIVHPLPLLCRAETEEAWWDYHSDINKQHIGIWCWDMISIYHWWDDVKWELINQWYDDMTDIYFFKE